MTVLDIAGILARYPQSLPRSLMPDSTSASGAAPRLFS